MLFEKQFFAQINWVLKDAAVTDLIKFLRGPAKVLRLRLLVPYG